MNPDIVKLITDLAPLGTMLTTVAGGIWIVLTYLRSQRDLAATRLFESRRPFLELQLRLYTEAAQVAGKLATAIVGSDDWNKAVFRFWELYWSELAVVEDERVAEAMVKAGEQLGKVADGAPRQVLEVPALELAHALGAGITREWGAHVGARALQISSIQQK